MGGVNVLLIRQTYYMEKRKEIKSLTLEIINSLLDMTSSYDCYLNNPTENKRDAIFQMEDVIDKNEKRIEKYILEILSIEQLNTDEIKWLFSMNRIIRELERAGDQLINIITISNVVDVNVLRPLIMEFLIIEKDMMEWLAKGISDNNISALKDVVSHDQYVNDLNKETYKNIANLIDDKKDISESKLKMIIISRFLERVGDHLVNSARVYINSLAE